MKIITGSTGTAHITSNNDGEFNQGIFGEGLVVLSNGNKLAAQIKDSNTITIKDGDLIMQGRHALIEPNTTEDVTIETGSVGKKRIDLIVAKYQLNESTGYESISLVVKKGTETTGNPEEPSYTTGNIRTGSLVAEMPLYKVNVDGITISSVVKMFNVVLPRDADTLGGRISAEDVEKSFAPNYARILYPFTEVADTNPISYVATENCWAVANFYGYNDKKGFCRIDNVITNMCSCSSTTIVLMRELIPLKKGQTITFFTEYSTLKTSFTIYGC